MSSDVSQHCIIIVKSMFIQAQVKPIAAHAHGTAQVQVYWNHLPVEVKVTVRVNPKYNKVTIELRRRLISQVRHGSSIIQASRKLGINYSTAKSIFQTLRARASGRIKRKRYVQTDFQEQEDKTSSWRILQKDDFPMF